MPDLNLVNVSRVLVDAVDPAREEMMREVEEKERAFFDNLRRVRTAEGGRLKEEQLFGIRWLSAMHDLGLSCILGDEMGVGKTAQVIFFLYRLRDSLRIPGPFLVAVPFAVLEVWEAELRKWGETYREVTGRRPFTAYKYHGRDRKPPPTDSEVVLTAHTTFSAEYDVLGAYIPKWRVVVVDEAHRAKDGQTILSKSLPLLEADMYLLMSGTVVHNNVDREFARMLELVMPRELTARADLQARVFA